MNFISPLTALIAAGITIPSLVLLYFLKLKRKRMVVPSTLLWQRAVQDLQVNSPFQKIKNNLLLWIQLLLLIALLIAMARPTNDTLADPGRRVVIVIDQSASMNALDPKTGKTRLEQAQRQALRLIDNLAAQKEDDEQGVGSAMVIAFGHSSRVMTDFTTDLDQVRRAIRAVKPTDQRSHIDQAMNAIEPNTRQGAGDSAVTVHVFSDGQVQGVAHAGRQLTLAGAKIRYHRVGPVDPSAARNVGVVALSARRVFERPELVQVFARLVNYGPKAVTTHVTLEVNGIAHVERVTIPAAAQPPTPAQGDAIDLRQASPGTVAVSFDLNWSGSASVRVSHDFSDELSVDDAAYLMLVPARAVRVLLVTHGNDAIQGAASGPKVKELVTLTPTQFEALDPASLVRGNTSSQEGFDVIIFDRHSPSQVPQVPSLYFQATPPIKGFDRRASRDDTPPNEYIIQWDRSSDLLANVELSEIPLRRPGRLVVPRDGHILAIGHEGPVMAELTRDGIRHVAVSFDVYESLWPLRISFPVFFDIAMPVLGLGRDLDIAGVEYRTGDNAQFLLDAPLDEVIYTGPATLNTRIVGNHVTVASFPHVGVYRTEAAVGERVQQLAVNLLDQHESDTRTAAELRIDTTDVAVKAQAVEVQQELWPWFVWGALALLAVEWLVYVKRMRI